MDLAMVERAQHHQFGQFGVAADLVRDGVVGVAPPERGVATGKHAAAVSLGQGGPFSFGGIAAGVLLFAMSALYRTLVRE